MLLMQYHVLSEQCSDARSQPLLLPCLAACNCLPSHGSTQERQPKNVTPFKPASQPILGDKPEMYKGFKLWWYEQLAATGRAGGAPSETAWKAPWGVLRVGGKMNLGLLWGGHPGLFQGWTLG